MPRAAGAAQSTGSDARARRDSSLNTPTLPILPPAENYDDAQRTSIRRDSEPLRACDANPMHWIATRPIRRAAETHQARQKPLSAPALRAYHAADTLTIAPAGPIAHR